MKHSIIALKNIIRASLPALLMAVAASPCTGLGAKKEVPPDATDREIIQMAQQAFNNSNFKLSEHYYNVLLQRYGTNTVDYIIGKFEIAHIAIRKKDYETAVPILTEIIDIYDETPTGELPPSYKVLAQNDLNKVPERLRMSITADGKQNDYYENDDYGDTGFFAETDYRKDLGTQKAGSKKKAGAAAPQDEDDDDYNYQGDYSENGSYWD
ncbi:MAG: hypothetical protein II837_02815 [Treponema sp.]|nr:hypothetical protein [Treponema sp.]MBQ7167761.1 hypothetical protein [Treponema sp.]